MSKNKIMTTAAGCPVADNQNSLTAGSRGPVLMQDVHLMEKLAHFNRERVRNGWCMRRGRAPTVPSL